MQDKPPRSEWSILETCILWASILVAIKVLVVDRILFHLG